MEEINNGDWGIRINPKHFSKFDLDAPEWVKESRASSWYSEGYIVWDAQDKKVVNLNVNGAVVILDQLEKSESWKTNGIDVTESYISISVPLPRKGSRKSQENQAPPKTENVTIRIHLSPERAATLYSFLKPHEMDIRSTWKLRKYQFEQGMAVLIDLLLNSPEVKPSSGNGE